MMGTTAGRVLNAAEENVAGMRRRVESTLDDRVASPLADAAGAIQGHAEDAYGRAQAEAATIAAHVRAHPFATIAIAAMTGYLTARLLGR